MGLEDFKRDNSISTADQTTQGLSRRTIQTDLEGRLLSEVVTRTYSQISLKEYEE